jgi:DNA-binding YbaB/EbfC family protein
MKGMGNMQGMMKQMQKMQKQMTDEQDRLNATEFTGKSTNDYVVATLTGDRRVTNLEVNADVVDPDDVDMLTDLVMLAVNDALTQIDTTTEKTMGKYTKGLPF